MGVVGGYSPNRHLMSHASDCFSDAHMLNVVDAEGYRGKKAHFVRDQIPRIAEQFRTTLRGRYRLRSAEAADAIVAS